MFGIVGKGQLPLDDFIEHQKNKTEMSVLSFIRYSVTLLYHLFV
jgi:hypothetical protein